MPTRWPAGRDCRIVAVMGRSETPWRRAPTGAAPPRMLRDRRSGAGAHAVARAPVPPSGDVARQLQVLPDVLVRLPRVDDAVQIGRSLAVLAAVARLGAPRAVGQLQIDGVERAGLLMAQRVLAVGGGPGALVFGAHRLGVGGILDALAPLVHVEALAERDAARGLVGGVEQPGAEVIELVAGGPVVGPTVLRGLLLHALDHRPRVQVTQRDECRVLREADAGALPRAGPQRLAVDVPALRLFAGEVAPALAGL